MAILAQAFQVKCWQWKKIEKGKGQRLFFRQGHSYKKEQLRRSCSQPRHDNSEISFVNGALPKLCSTCRPAMVAQYKQGDRCGIWQGLQPAKLETVPKTSEALETSSKKMLSLATTRSARIESYLKDLHERGYRSIQVLEAERDLRQSLELGAWSKARQA